MERGRGRQVDGEAAGEGRLLARPGQQAGSAEPGLHPLGLDGPRDGLLYVPAGHDPTRPAPLVVLLHGAGADARDILPVLRGHADALGFLVLAPDSRRATWDVILGGYGPDVSFLYAALDRVFGELAVDPARLAVGGFSDGASYAVSLGVGNGDLFSHVLAFAPGFMVPTRHAGTPSIFISHGVHDRVLPIDRCSRRIVPQLRRAGREVEYREFAGGHTVPPGIAADAFAMLSSELG